jgi:hypothetical protein
MTGAGSVWELVYKVRNTWPFIHRSHRLSSLTENGNLVYKLLLLDILQR